LYGILTSMNTEHLKTTFDRDGFVIVPGVISPSRVSELRDMLDGVLEGRVRPDRAVLVGKDPDAFHMHLEPTVADDPTVPLREKVRIIFHLCHTHSYFWRLATAPEILDIVEALIGPDIRFYTDQTFLKPAHHGSEVPWHQDSGYWPAAEPRLLSCWLALDDVSEDNGCVRFIPGSHRSVLAHQQVHTGNATNLTVQPEALDSTAEVPVIMTAGSASFHHSLTVHRSLANTSDRARRGLIMIFLPADLTFLKPWNFPYGFKLVRGAEAVAATS